MTELARAEIASATYFELVGERGLVRRASAAAGATATPAFRVLETLGGFRGGNVVGVGWGGFGPIVGLGMEWPERFELLLANLDPEPRSVTIRELAGPVGECSTLVELAGGEGEQGAAWRPLGAGTAGGAKRGDTAGQAGQAGPRTQPRASGAGVFEIELGGYGVVRLAGGPSQHAARGPA